MFHHRHPTRLAFAVLLTLGLLAAPSALAQNGGGSGNSSGSSAASSAGVVIKGLGLLTTWINGQDDNCAVAALAAAWGSHCKLTKKECTDTGFYSAECEKTAANACGKGFGKARAEESAFGKWAGYTTDPEATADAYAAHAGQENDSHGARGWAKASVDGTSEAEEEQDPSPPLTSGIHKNQAANPGEVYAVLDIYSIDLSTLAQNPDASSGYTGSFVVDGSEVWSATAALDASGNLTTTGGLTPSDFSVALDSATGQWTASLSGFSVEVQVGYIAPGSGDTVSTSVSYDSEVDADAGSGGDELVTVAVSLDQLALNDSAGMPVLYGNTVQLVDPVTVLSDSQDFSPVLDTDVSDGHASIGLLDPHLPAGLFAGDVIYGLIGTVNTHDGRTVLTDLVFEGVVPGQLAIQSQPLSLRGALAMAEDIEGDLVTLEGLSLVDPSQWPSSQNMGTVTVTDGLELLDLAISLSSGIGGSEPPVGPFDVTGSFSQSDELEPYEEGYQLRLRSPEDLGRGGAERGGKAAPAGR